MAAEQTTGVLREVLSGADGLPLQPAFSRQFSPELRAIGAELTPVAAAGEQSGQSGQAGPSDQSGQSWAWPGQGRERVWVSPPPAQGRGFRSDRYTARADATDPAAGYLATLGTLQPGQQGRRAAGRRNWRQCRLAGSVLAWWPKSPETKLALARALITARRPGWCRGLPGRTGRGRSWRTGESPGTTGCANSQAAIRRRPGRRSPPSTTNCRARARAEARPRLRGGGPGGRGRGTSLLPARHGRSTGPTSAPRSVRPRVCPSPSATSSPPPSPQWPPYSDTSSYHAAAHDRRGPAADHAAGTECPRPTCARPNGRPCPAVPR